MATLIAMCEAAGLRSARTFIASGNVVFASDDNEDAVRKALEERLAPGKPVGVRVRTEQDVADLLAGNPFPDAAGNRAVILFVDDPLPPDALERATGVRDERMSLGRRAIYIDYCSGMADSRLRIPAARNGTARNLNTVAKLAEMAAALG